MRARRTLPVAAVTLLVAGGQASAYADPPTAGPPPAALGGPRPPAERARATAAPVERAVARERGPAPPASARAGGRRHRRLRRKGVRAASLRAGEQRGAVGAAAVASVAIRDFSFGPATITVHVGDTVSWRNDGPSPHTATASDGSFDTGTLAAGASASHRFTTAGRFAYICTIHPIMRATVVVLATSGSGPSTTTTNGTGAQGSAAPTGATAATAASGPQLPRTGIDVAALALSGLVLTAAGTALRRQAR